MLIAVTGCSGFEDFRPEAGLAVKEIAVTKSETVGTRARYDEATRELFWTGGDKYFYYTFGTSDALSDVNVGTLSSASNITEIIPVTYDLANDNTVVIGSTGTKVGAVSSRTRTTVTFTGGIPAVQDGTVEGSYVNLGIANLQTQNATVLGSRQAYISFNLLTSTVGDRTVKFFTVNGKDGETVCGNATFAIASADVTNVSGGSNVVVNVTAAEQRNYYVALAPGTYTYGLRICLYDEGTVDSSTGAITDGHICGYVDTKPGVEVKSGRILALGDLTAHKTVPGTTLVSHPSEVRIAKISGLTQTKKLYIEYGPSDMTDIEFEYSVPNVISAERGPDADYNDGKNYMTVIVTPVCADRTDPTAESTCILTIKDKYPAPGMTPAQVICTVNVGMFIDPGLPSGTLWAATNVKGDGSSSPWGFETTLDAYGDMYPWGWTKPRPDVSYPEQWKYLEWAANPEWNDNPTFDLPQKTNSTWSINMTGGRYFDSNVTRMLDEDDVCKKISPSFRIPTSADCEELRNNTEHLSCVNFGNHMYFICRSKVKYYEDVDVYFRLSGWHTVDNCISSRDVEARYWSSEFAPKDTGLACADMGAQGWTIQYKSGYHCWVDCLSGEGGYYRRMVWHSCSVKAVWTPTD